MGKTAFFAIPDYCAGIFVDRGHGVSASDPGAAAGVLGLVIAIDALAYGKAPAKPNTSDGGERARLGFTNGVRNDCIRRYKAMGRSCTTGSEVCHKTPLAAGGCPSGPGTWFQRTS